MRRRISKILCVTLALCCLPFTVWAEQLPRPSAAAYDNFGASTSVFVNLAIVGAYGADINGADAGAAYIYQYAAQDGWSLAAQLPNDAENFATAGTGFTQGDQFGRAVAIYGNVAVVGAPYDDPGGVDNAGAAYVFQQEGDVWRLKGRLTAGDKQINSEFGASVAIEGNYIVVGAPKNNPVGSGGASLKNCGAVYVFERPDDGWTDMVDTAKLIPADAREYAAFGASLSLSGDLVLIGAPDMNTYTGAAYVFQRSGAGLWSQSRKLTDQNGAVNDRFGASVDISGALVAVGAPYRASTETEYGKVGAVYIFTSGGSEWTQSAILESPGALLADVDVEKGFGYSVALQDDVAVFGAYDSFNEPELGHYGHAHVYNVSDWTHAGIIGEGMAGYGYSVDVSEYFVMGGDRELNSRQGDAFVRSKSLAGDNLPPIVYGIRDYAVRMDGGSVQDDFNIYDFESLPGALSLELICTPICPPDPTDPTDPTDPPVNDPLSCDIDLDGDCVADISAVISGTGETRGLAITTPAGNATTGTDAATVRVTDENGATDEAVFNITVNSPPVFDAISGKLMQERTVSNPSSLEVSFSVSDAETAYGSLILDATSNNQLLVADGNLVIDQDNGVLTITPELNQSGTATITLSAVDSVGNVKTEPFVLTVNSLPVIGELDPGNSIPVNNQSTPVTVTRTFTITDKEPTDATPLTLNSVGPASSSNANLFTSFDYSRTGDEVALSLDIASGESGNISIPVKVTDKDGGVATKTLQLLVEGTSPQIINVKPSDSVLMNEGEYRKEVTFDIMDTDTPISSITKTATSDAPAWLPDTKLSVSCPTNCKLTIYPPDSANWDQINGPATITLTVDDQDPATTNGTHDIEFTFNRKPVITSLPDIEVDEGDLLTFNFAVEDTNFNGNIGVSATNVSNPDMFANLPTSCQINSETGTYRCDLSSFASCDGSECNFSHQLQDKEWGVASIIVKATDAQGLAKSESFVLTVNDVNEKPALIPDLELSELNPDLFYLSMVEDQSGFVELSLSDGDWDQLTLAAVSLNEDVIPNAFDNLKLCKVPADWTGTFDSTASAPPADWTCRSAASYSLTSDASGNYGDVRLFIHPADNANEDLFGNDAAPDVEVSVSDGVETVFQEIDVNVDADPDPPALKLSTLKTSMDDDLDAVTAEASPVTVTASHPDGPMTLTFGVEPPVDTVFKEAYFIDGAGNATSSDTIQLGETLSLGLVLIPTPNVISDTVTEQISITATDENNAKATQTITAEVSPVNDPPNIIGLQPEYPCAGCPGAEPPWLQDERKTLRFHVDDPDVDDGPETLNVSAEWGLGVDPGNEYTPVVLGIGADGQVDLQVQPPDMLSGWLSLTVTVSDGELNYSQDTVINVQGVNYPPEFSAPLVTDLETKEDQTVSAELTITDAETARLSKLTLLKEWTSVYPENMPKGTFSGGLITDQGRATLDIHPPPEWPRFLDQPAHARIRLTIQEPDGTLSAPLVIDLLINGVPDAPKITSIKSLEPTPTIKEGGAYTLDFRVEDVDTPVSTMAIDASYDPGATDLALSLSTPVCTLETEYKKRCKLTVKADAQSFGEATISLGVQDDTPADYPGPLTGSLDAPLIVEKVEDPPVFQVIDALPIVTQEDKTATASYRITDPDPDTVPENLKVVASSLSWTWTDTTTPNAPVELALAGDMITISPSQNGFGRGVVNLDVTDGTNTVPASFDVEVTPVNDDPTIEFTGAPESPLDEDVPADLTFTVGDVETPVSNLILSYRITWTEGGDTADLTPYTDYLLVTGTGADKTMQFTPPAGQPREGKAVALITATVRDRDNENPGQDADQAVIEYLAVNDPPVIVKKNGLDVETVEEDSGTFYVDFTVSDPETLAENLDNLKTTEPVISGDNPDLLAECRFISDPDLPKSTRRLKLTPAPNENGQVDITVSVLDAPAPDGLESAPLTFTLEVTPVPDPPTISALRKEGSTTQETQIILDEGQTTADLTDIYIVEVDDPDTALSSLIVGATWAPVPNQESNFVDGEIRFEGTAESRTVVIAPNEYDSGYARITPWVKDSPGAAPVKSQPFELRVDPVNDAPVINAPIANPDDIIFVQGNEEYILRFEVRDVDSPPQNIRVSAESGDTDLLPQTVETRFDWGLIEEFDSTPNLDNMTHGLLMKPLPLGGADPVDVPVTIQATDQEKFTEFEFTLRIFPDVTPPKIRIRETVSINEDPAASEEVTFWVWDEKKMPWELDVFVSSGQTDYIPNSYITVEPIFTSASDPGYTTNADNWRLKFKPVRNAPFQDPEFTTQLSVSVNNGLFETAAEPPLSVTIHNQNDAPTISAIPNQEVHLNQAVTVNFTVDDVDEGPGQVTVSAAADPDIARFEFTNGDTAGEPTQPYVKDWTLKVIPSATTEAEKTFTVTVTATDTSGVTAPEPGEDGNTGTETFTINMAGVAPGDVDGSGTVDLADAVAALQVLAGIPPTSVFAGADIDNDGRVGFAEALNALRTAGGL